MKELMNETGKYLQELSNCDNVNSTNIETLVERVDEEEMMKRKELLKQYPIKFNEKQQRYYSRLDGSYKSATFRKNKKDLEDLIWERFKDSNEKNLKTIWRKFVEYRSLRVKNRAKDEQIFRLYIKDSPLASIELSEINIFDMDNFFRYCKKVNPNLKKKYFSTIKGVVSAMFEYAIQAHMMNYNFAKTYRVDIENFAPAIVHTDEERIFSLKEEEAIFELAYKTNNVYDLGICLLFYTGLRIGELCAIKWEDIIEYENKYYLSITKELVEAVDKDLRKGKTIVAHCKSAKGQRKIPLNTESIELLKRIKKMNIALDYPVFNSDYIFLRKNQNTNSELTYCTDRTFDSRLRYLCKETNMKYIKSPHDIRRTYATNLFYNNVNLKTIQLWMGHSTMNQTMEYIHQLITDEDTECLCNKENRNATYIKKVATLLI